MLCCMSYAVGNRIFSVNDYTKICFYLQYTIFHTNLIQNQDRNCIYWTIITGLKLFSKKAGYQRI